MKIILICLLVGLSTVLQASETSESDFLDFIYLECIITHTGKFDDVPTEEFIGEKRDFLINKKEKTFAQVVQGTLLNSEPYRETEIAYIAGDEQYILNKYSLQLSAIPNRSYGMELQCQQSYPQI